MHRDRLITAAILGPLVLAAVIWGSRLVFGGLVFTACFITLFEYYSMTFASRPFLRITGISAGLLAISSCLYMSGPDGLALGAAAALLVCLSAVIFTYGGLEDPFKALTSLFFGAFYIGGCLGSILLLRQEPEGVKWLLFLLLVVAAADSGAYYVGRAIGKRKLCPALSKGKTVEGAVGGLAACAVIAVIYWLGFFRQADPRALIPLAVLLGLASQLGDLTESIIKRACGVKDSGRILPGHGGMFDRIDGLMLSGVVLYWTVHLFSPFLLSGTIT